MIEPPKVIIFFDVSKMPFCLNRTDLTIQDSFFTLNICMRSFF